MLVAKTFRDTVRVAIRSCRFSNRLHCRGRVSVILSGKLKEPHVHCHRSPRLCCVSYLSAGAGGQESDVFGEAGLPGKQREGYPLPFTDRIALTKTEQVWDAVHVENEFIRVMILPQLGGRIHVGQDKTNGYDFFYRQNVIKPALVGLAGRGFGWSGV